jgi:acetyl esterase/lipase
MNKLQRLALKALSSPMTNVKKDYKLRRQLLKIIHPYLRPAYRMLDRKIRVEEREIPVRVFYPKVNQLPKVILFFHGGGWVVGDIDTYTTVCANMAEQTGHTVVSVDYRLAPEHPFPAGVEDCYYVAKELYKNLDLIHCEAEDITLAGDSAGANLAAVVSLIAKERGEFLPSKQILIYPATNNDHTDDSPYPSVRENGTDYILTSQLVRDYMELYVQNLEYRSSPHVAPLLAEDLSGQPKTLIITAEFDPLRDEGEAYGRKLEKFGNHVEIYRMKDALHGFFSLPWNTDSVVRSYEIINRFLNEPGDRIERSR